MFWNDPNLYSVSYKDINPLQAPFLGTMLPWQTAPRFVPTGANLQPTFYNLPFNVPYNPFVPYPQAQQSFHPYFTPFATYPYNISPFAMTPFQQVGMPQQIPYRPFGI